MVGFVQARGVPFELSDSIAIIVIAALLSLLPVVILLWIYYVRERSPSVRGPTMTRFFALGMLSVAFAVVLERAIYALWRGVSPATSRVFFAEGIAAADLSALVTTAAVSFGVIAVVEEGVRYILMRVLFHRTQDFDQLIDGVQYGFALGLGFSFIENTLYFLQLFRSLDFDTLVVVFFLRFLISTVGHLSFGGVMGYFLAAARVFPSERRRYLQYAFFFPWLMHGLFDTLLAVQLSFYTVLLLLLPAYLFWSWFQDERMFELHVLRGRRLRFPVAPTKRDIPSPRPHVVEVLPAMKSCPNCYVPLQETSKQCPSCGLRLHRRGFPRLFPFLSEGES